MSETQTDQTQTPDPNEPPAIRQIREAQERAEARAKAAEEEAQKNSAAQRELVFLKAGVDTENPLGKYLFDTYTGDLSKEAVQKVATELGLLKTEETGNEQTPPSNTQTEPSLEEQRQATERARLAAGGQTPDQTREDSTMVGLDRFHERLKSGDRREEAAAEYFDRRIDAAAKGDPNAIWTPEKHRAAAVAAGVEDGS